MKAHGMAQDAENKRTFWLVRFDDGYEISVETSDKEKAKRAALESAHEKGYSGKIVSVTLDPIP